MHEIIIEPLSGKDLEDVYKIELLSFSMPWSKKVWMDELMNSQLSNYIAAKLEEKDKKVLIGYSGFWLVKEEAMIVNIAVHPDYRGRKIGERLLKNTLNLAREKGAKVCTLEVRVSNESAISLYKKFGFEIIAVRKKYYTDNGEDAYVMWLNPIKISF